jgi:hypothetical protein
MVVAWIAYPGGRLQRMRLPLAALRALSVAAVLALLLDLAVGAAAPAAALVALDASASWVRSGDTDAWRAAAESSASARAGGGSQVLFGDSVRDATIQSQPADQASRVLPVLQRAAGAGQRVVIVTDGALDDADALQQAVAGSRLVVIPGKPVADRAVVELNAPAEARVGDTVTLQVRVVSDDAMRAEGAVRWSLDGVVLGESALPALAAHGETVLQLRAVIPAGDSIGVLRAALTAAADAVPRNDTLVTVVRRDVRQRIVIASTAPDADIRDVAAALRANVAMPTDAYFRIAPSRWVRDGGLTPVEESVVRAAVRGASLAVLHGDTAAMGTPTQLRARALLLLAPPTADATEMVVRAAPSSPLQAALAGIVVESLPPLLVLSPARGGVTALSAAAGQPTARPTPIVTTIDGNVRRVVITAAGYSRWRVRGGVSEVAFQALVGGATDWLLGARGSAVPAVPANAVVRAGEPVRWRRGSGAQALVSLTRDGDGATRRDTLVFGTGATANAPPLSEGIWRGLVDSASVVLPVSASREWLPQPIGARSRMLNGEAVAVRRGARGISWLYLATVLLLAAEWLLRRRAGLR